MSEGLRVFLVEDEPMIRILVTDMLGELGHAIAAEAGHVARLWSLRNPPNSISLSSM
jgi:CheY-like chemotaxis protein